MAFLGPAANEPVCSSSDLNCQENRIQGVVGVHCLHIEEVCNFFYFFFKTRFPPRASAIFC